MQNSDLVWFDKSCSKSLPWHGSCGCCGAAVVVVAVVAVCPDAPVPPDDPDDVDDEDEVDHHDNDHGHAKEPDAVAHVHPATGSI